MKRLWMPLTVAATIIAIGLVAGGAALAQENTTAGTPGISSFASRVATILGLDSAQVQKAMDQAHREIRDEAVQKKLAGLVAQGRLTQAQADAYLAWYKTRPAEVPGLRGPGFGFDGHASRHGMRGPGSWHGYAFPPSQHSYGAPVVPAQ